MKGVDANGACDPCEAQTQTEVKSNKIRIKRHSKKAKIANDGTDSYQKVPGMIM